MRLVNFEIISSIEMSSDGVIWDIHNCGHFNGLELLREENAILMKWIAGDYPWFGQAKNFSGMNLLFKDLFFLEIGPRDDEMPMTEDTCVESLLKVTPEDREKDPYLRAVYDFSTDFHLFFHFQSTRNVEIGSRTAHLIPVA
jgi:hypothetical protein